MNDTPPRGGAAGDRSDLAGTRPGNSPAATRSSLFPSPDAPALASPLANGVRLAPPAKAEPCLGCGCGWGATPFDASAGFPPYEHRSLGEHRSCDFEPNFCPGLPVEGEEEWAVDCPVRPLGHRLGVYYFLTEANEIRRIGAGGVHSGAVLSSLVGGDIRWFERRFGRCAVRREPVRICWVSAGNWLMRACRRAGLVDPHTMLHGADTAGRGRP